MYHRIVLTFIFALLCSSWPCLAGKFYIIDLYYTFDPPTANTIHGRVAATAEYRGNVDSNDNQVFVQTSACESNGGPPACSAGFGIHESGPFERNQKVRCNSNHCMGHRYVSKPCCGTATTTDFSGKAGATIYHQYNPDIHTASGFASPVACKACGGGAGCLSEASGRPHVLSLRGRDLPFMTERLAQSSFQLRRIERTKATSFLMDEWAVLSSGPAESGSTRASSSDLATWLQANGVLPAAASSAELGDGAENEWAALVVMAPPHPDNQRDIPLPVPMLKPSSNDSGLGTGLLVVRADFSRHRTLRQLEVIAREGEIGSREWAFLRDSLMLEYGSEKRHRAVAYAVVEFDGEAHLADWVTLLPRCCPGEWEPPWEAFQDGR